MMRVAIFVDAGYAYAQGGESISGSKQRHNLELNESAFICKLREIANRQTGDMPLLRIYWYDGLLRGRMSPEQERLADMDNVKFRFGTLRYGRQKGVDSLIVTDLIELARNQAISDAVLLSGDDDVRIGVEIAQSFGVRVHLIGIESSSGQGSQSRLLLQAADTTTELSGVEVQTFLKVRSESDADSAEASRADASNDGMPQLLDNVVDELVPTLSQAEISDIIANSEPNSPIPYQVDRRLLILGGEKVGRDLEESEKHYIRRRLKERVVEYGHE